MSEFQKFPKIPRLNRNCIATEKIDGTNAAIIIESVDIDSVVKPNALARLEDTPYHGFALEVFAQSRTRLLQPGKQSDNFGFAAWVKEHAFELATGLGKGYHYGEWWGSGIQRGYGLMDGEKRFSLFNVSRWHDTHANNGDFGDEPAPKCCYVVPVLATGTTINAVAEGAIAMLEDNGSFAAPGYDNPEGVVIYHTAASASFKVTVEGDESPKGTRSKEATA